jgi:hypothetical protein
MRKRSKYRPKRVLVNPVGYVLESMTPVTKHDSYLLDIKIKNSAAMASLFQGTATKQDMDTLIAMSNMVEALWQLGFGEEYKDVAVEGRVAILNIVHRAVTTKRFVPTGEQIKALQLLMELHDAQMDVITIKDMERALDYADNQIRQKRATLLPPVSEVLK